MRFPRAVWMVAVVSLLMAGCGPKPAETETPPVVDLPEPSAPAESVPPPAPAESSDAAPAASDKVPAADPPASAAPAATPAEGPTEKPAENPPADGPTLGSPSPDQQSRIDLKVADYEGILAHVRNQSGKVVVLDCWSTYCDECLNAFPGLVALHKKYGPEKVACVSLSFDYASGDVDDVKPGVQSELERLGATFTNFVSNESDTELYKKFDFVAVPAVFVYDQKGNLVKKFDNSDPKAPAFTYDEVEALVVELLNGKAS